MRHFRQLVCAQWFVLACGGATGSTDTEGCAGGDAAGCDAGQAADADGSSAASTSERSETTADRGSLTSTLERSETTADGATLRPTSESSGTSDRGSDVQTSDAEASSERDGGVMGIWPDGAAVQCCPISDEVDSCMDFGGADLGGCATVCDGICSGEWTRGFDSYGCPIWLEPLDSGEDCFAYPHDPDAGDAQVTAVPDATVPDGAVGGALPDGAVDASPAEGAVDGSANDGAVAEILPDGAVVECCPMSPEPDCCMAYGGRNLGECATVCDGMSWPNADWQRGVDSFGCPVWIEPPRTWDVCGAAPLDSDASVADGAVGSDASFFQQDPTADAADGH